MAINSVERGAPAVMTTPERLRLFGRRDGVLATDSCWEIAYPRTQRSRAPLPFGRDVWLGDVRLRVFPAGAEPGCVHLILRGEEKMMVAITPAVDDSADPTLPMPDGMPDAVLIGPVANEPRGARRAAAEARSRWPRAEIVLYGPGLTAATDAPTWATDLGAVVVRPPAQGSLF